MSRMPSPLKSLLPLPTKRRGGSASPKSARSFAEWHGKPSKRMPGEKRFPWMICFDRVEDDPAVLAIVLRPAARNSAGCQARVSSLSFESCPSRFAFQEVGGRRGHILGPHRPRLPGTGGHEARSRRLVLDRQPFVI